MNSPFAPELRRYIPWPEYRALEAERAVSSLISRAEMSSEEATVRFRLLRDDERRCGFVYLGERKWLEGHTSGSPALSYPAWVRRQFAEVLFKGRFIFGVDSDLPGHWGGTTDDLSPFWLPHEPTRRVEVDEVSVFVPGDGAAPDGACLCRAFEALHNLHYYLLQVRQADCAEGLSRIVIKPGGSRWDMELISEYGAGYDLEFVGRGPVG